MSYIKRVLADRPLGFWNLHNTTDMSGNGNDLVFHNFPPYVDFDIIQPVNTSTHWNTEYNQYTLARGAKFYKSDNTYASINNQERYNAFVSGTEKLSFGMEFWFTLPPNNNAKFDYLIDITNVGSIYVYQDTINFVLNNGQGYVSKQIKSLEPQIHIFAYYSNRTIGIFVNGVEAVSTKLPENFVFTNEVNDVVFKLTDSSRSFFNSDYIIYNSLAFYDRVLTEKEIKSHMMWGFNDSKPQSYVKKTTASYFDIKDTKDKTWFKQSFDTEKNWNSGILNNLIVKNNGLTLKGSMNLEENNSFEGLLNYVSINNFSMQTQIDGSMSAGQIFKIENSNTSEYIKLRKTNDDTLILEYVTDNDTNIILESSAISNSTYDIFLSIKNSYVSLYISGYGLFVSNSYPILNSNKAILYYNTFADTNVYNTYVDANEYYAENISFEDNLILTISSQFGIRSIGKWIYTIPASLFYGISGGRISWHSAAPSITNVLNPDISIAGYRSVYVEIDKGNGWEQVFNEHPIEGIQTDQYLNNDIKIKVTIVSPNCISEEQPRIDNLNISLYKTLSIFDDTNNYHIGPYYNDDLSVLHSYSIKSNNFNVLSRSNNFGLKIPSSSSAIIGQNVPSNGYKSLEFWFRPDQIGSEQDQYILDTQVSNKYIKFDKDTKVIDASIEGSYNQQKYFLGMPYAPGDGFYYFSLLSSTDYVNWNLESIEPTQYTGTPQISLYYLPGKIIAKVFDIQQGTKIFVSEDNGITWNGVLGLSYQYKFFNVGDYIFLTAYGSGAGDLWWCNINNLATWTNYGLIDSPGPDIHQVADGAEGFYFIGGAPMSTPKIYYLTIIDIINQTMPNVVSLSGIPSSYFIFDSVYEKMNNFVYLLYRDFPFGDSYLYKIDANQAANSSFSTVSIPTSTPWHRISIYAHQSSSQIDAFLIPENDYHPIKATTNLQNANPTWTTKHTFGAPAGGTVYINKILNMAIGSSETLITYDNGQNWTTTSITPTSIPTGWDSSYTNLIKIQITNDAFNHGMDSITETINTSGFNKVYINSNDLSLSSFTVMDKEPIHIVCIYSENNINNIYLNKSISLNGDLSATYGYIALYPNELSSSEVYDRYISFLTNKTEIVNESNSIGTLAEYSGGDAVVAYSSASKQAAI